MDAIMVDVLGDIVVGGHSNSGDMGFFYPAYPNTHQSSLVGYTDGILVKFSKYGVVKWGTYYGGDYEDYIYALSGDKTGNIFLTGTTTSTFGIATSGAHQGYLGGSTDVIVARFNKDGSFGYGTYYGGSGIDVPNDLKLDFEGNILVSGNTTSDYGMASANGYDTSYYKPSANDGFLLKMDNTGTRIWATYYGGNNTDYLYGITSDALGNIYGVGFTNSTTDIASFGAIQSTLRGTGDGYLIIFDKTGARQLGTYYGGNAHDYLKEVKLDKLGNLFIAGYSTSDSGIATPNATDTTNNGGFDAFLVRYDLAQPSVLGNNVISQDQGLCLGEAVTVLTGTTPTGATGTYTYLWTQSTTGAAGAYAPAAGLNNTHSYSPGVLSVNTWYKRTVFSGTEVHTSNVVAISVSEKLNAGFITNKMIQCDRDNNFVFTDTTLNGNPAITRTWDFGNGLYSGNVVDSMTYVFGTENTFVVTLINSLNGACADTASIRIYLIPNPDPVSINGNPNVIRGTTETYSVTPSNGSTYTWMYDKGVGFNSTANIQIRWTDIGTTELKLLERTGGGCYGDTAYLNITIDKPLGGSELAWDNDILLYPNPSNGRVFIQDGLNRDLVVNVQSILGEQVFEGKAQLDGSIDLSTLSNGIYLLKLSTPEGDNFVRRIELLK